MRASAKVRAPQLVRPATAASLVPAVFLDSSTQVHMVNAEDIARLSRLASVLVLIAKASVEGRGVVITPKSTSDNARAHVFGPPDKAGEQFKTLNSVNEFSFGDVTVNFPEMLAYRSGKPVGLKNMEFKTLKFLIQNARRVISRDELLNEVWGYANYPCTRTVDNHILRLRQKLEREPSRPVHFHTVHSVGYKFVP